jgi:hypothetical protein
VSSAAGRSEGFFLRSTNAVSPGVAPEAIEFELVPRGNFGLRAATGKTAEEGNLVQLSDGSFYAVFRTVSGFLGRAVSKDGIEWQDRLHPHYDTADYGAGMCEHKHYICTSSQLVLPITARVSQPGNASLMTTMLNDYAGVRGVRRPDSIEESHWTDHAASFLQRKVFDDPFRRLAAVPGYAWL